MKGSDIFWMLIIICLFYTGLVLNWMNTEKLEIRVASIEAQCNTIQSSPPVEKFEPKHPFGDAVKKMQKE